MSRPILELGHCQVSSIKICCDRQYNGGGRRGDREGWKDLGREDRVAPVNKGQIQCGLLTGKKYTFSLKRILPDNNYDSSLLNLIIL